MALSRRAGNLLLLAACFTAGIAGGHGLARLRSAGSEAVAADAVSTAPATALTPAVDAGPPRTTGTPIAAPALPASPPTGAAPKAALPPVDATVADYYDELLARAQAGDGAAGRRLADDLYECASQARQLDTVENLLDGRRGRGGAERPPRPESSNPPTREQDDRRLEAAERVLQRAQQTEKRCAGLQAKAPQDPSELIRNAALAGDAQAQLCYALAPNEWRRDTLSPEWVDWSERWNQESTAMLRQAFDRGVPEAALVLSQMYSTWQWREGRPWSGRLGDDPYWAYAYGLVARESLNPAFGSRWDDNLAALTQRLDSARIAQAQAWAAAARRRIPVQPSPAPSGRQAPFCDMVQRMAGFL